MTMLLLILNERCCRCEYGLYQRAVDVEEYTDTSTLPIRIEEEVQRNNEWR